MSDQSPSGTMRKLLRVIGEDKLLQGAYTENKNTWSSSYLDRTGRVTRQQDDQLFEHRLWDGVLVRYRWNVINGTHYMHTTEGGEGAKVGKKWAESESKSLAHGGAVVATEAAAISNKSQYETTNIASNSYDNWKHNVLLPTNWSCLKELFAWITAIRGWRGVTNDKPKTNFNIDSPPTSNREQELLRELESWTAANATSSLPSWASSSCSPPLLILQHLYTAHPVSNFRKRVAAISGCWSS